MRVGVLMLVAALAAGPAMGHASQARLKASSVKPLRIAGTGFKPRERVTVRVVQFGTKWTLTARVSARGAFVMIFPASFDACSGAAILRAVGAAGDAATLKLGAERMCNPPSG